MASVKRPRPPEDPDSSKAAYFRALRWLTVRELSAAQVRIRLADRGYTETAIGPALERLIHDRTLDDRRAATAIARTEARVRRHGPRRVMGKLIAMKIDRDLAKEVVRDLFGATDEEALLDTTLERRLRDKPERLKDPRERRKLLAYLVRQGFSASAASSAMRRKSK
ncbi:MAG: RecX family transcriptional regulator [Acidobacteria bacterium]|nr:RecX family transcriptional regulator [Acidobacteriota bacterium]